MLHKKSTGVEPHYLDVWLPTHDDDEVRAEKLASNIIKCYATFVIYPYVHTQYSVGLIYTRVEENPRACAREPEVGALQHQCCVSFGQRHPAWKVCQNADCFPLTIVSW
jgi:hypothetical protein